MNKFNYRFQKHESIIAVIIAVLFACIIFVVSYAHNLSVQSTRNLQELRQSQSNNATQIVSPPTASDFKTQQTVEPIAPPPPAPQPSPQSNLNECQTTNKSVDADTQRSFAQLYRDYQSQKSGLMSYLRLNKQARLDKTYTAYLDRHEKAYELYLQKVQQNNCVPTLAKPAPKPR